MGHSYLSLVRWKWAGQGRPKRLWAQPRPVVLLRGESSGSCLSREGWRGCIPWTTRRPLHSVHEFSRSSVPLLCVAAIHGVSLGTTESKVAALQTAG